MFAVGIHLIAIAFLAPWTVTATQNETIGTLDLQCPIKDTCPPTLFPHESNCGLYYECIGGRPQLRHCAAGLHFSIKWQGCVRPAVSECNQQEEGYCRNGERLKHECVCTKFYECKNGWKVLRDCPTGWHFNEGMQTCIEGTDCGGEIRRGVCREGERIIHECQCDKYYLCKGGRKALRDCPSGTGFDPISRDCIPGVCDFDSCSEGEQRPHECLCHKFYKCKNREWVGQDCPVGYHFSPHRLICLPQSEARCERSNSEPGDCPIPTPNGPWPHECDCRLYYTCQNGRKEIQMCSWGYYFDRARLGCSYAKNVHSCQNHWDNWLKAEATD